jgi:hypothetical protein
VVLDKGEFSASWSIRFIPGVIDTGTYWTTGWLSSIYGLAVLEKTTISSIAESRIPFVYSATNYYIFTCRMARVTKITGYSSDDWIY